MGKKLSVGDTVLCRYYQFPEKRFYGKFFQGVIIEINSGVGGEHTYRVAKIDNKMTVVIWRKEIIRRVK